MYHDTQGREIEDAEMDNMRRDAQLQPTWNIWLTHDEIIALSRAVLYYADKPPGSISGLTIEQAIEQRNDEITTLFHLNTLVGKFPTLED